MLTHCSLPCIYSGDAYTNGDLGVLLTKYFERRLGIHITTTMVRSLVETTTDVLRRQGMISAQQQQAVQNINGHTSRVTQEYYIRQARNDDVTYGRAVFDTIGGLQRSNQDNVTTAIVQPSRLEAALPVTPDTRSLDIPLHSGSSSSFLSPTSPIQSDQYPVKEWGTRHPDFALGFTQRCQWTPTEVQWIGRWIVKDTTDYPHMHSRISRCLKALNAEPPMWPWFHRNHVLNSARMRAGWDRYQLDYCDE